MIQVFIPVWKRPEITRICFEGLKKHMKKMEMRVFCVISEFWAVDMCNEFGFEYLLTDNFPLGKKLNKGLAKVIENDFDYLMTSGSDNLYSEKLFEIYKDYYGKYDLFGLDKCYFVEGKKAKLVDYQLTIIGAGRMIRKKALLKACKRTKVKFLTSCGGLSGSYPKGSEWWIESKRAIKEEKTGILKIIEVGINLWDDKKDNSLSHNSNVRLFESGASNIVIQNKEVLIIDLKSDENIWKYNDLEGTNVPIQKVRKEIQWDLEAAC